MQEYRPTGLIDQDYIDLYHLVRDAADWDPTDGTLVLLECRLAAELEARGLTLPAEPQHSVDHDAPAETVADPTTH